MGWRALAYKNRYEDFTFFFKDVHFLTIKKQRHAWKGLASLVKIRTNQQGNVRICDRTKKERLLRHGCDIFRKHQRRRAG